MKHLKKFESWFGHNEIIGSALSLLSGILIVAPWLTSIYFEHRNAKLERDADLAFKKRENSIRLKIEYFLSKINSQIEELKNQLNFLEGEDNTELKKQLVSEFRNRIFSLLKREDSETQNGVLDILKEIEPKIKEYFRIENL